MFRWIFIITFMLAMQSQYATAQDEFSPQGNLSGAWSAEDDAQCFVREYTNNRRQAVTWVCENPSEQWSYVFTGFRSEANNEILEGSIAFIPKGTRLLRRDVTFRVGRRTTRARPGAEYVTKRAIFPGNGFEDASFVTFIELEGTRADFTKITRSKFGPYQDYYPAPGGSQDLTGVWYGNDGGVYYILQRGPFVTWFGESPTRAWANVAEGGRIGQNMSLSWVDVPKGGTQGRGQIGLRVEGPNRLVRTSVSGGFGGSVWTREDSTRVVQADPIGGLRSWDGLCPFDANRSDEEGDREFGGGPRISVTISLSIEPRFQRSVRATVNFSAVEMGGDQSSISGNWTRTLYIAPQGRRITEILSDTSSSFNFVDEAAGGEFTMGRDTVSEDQFGFLTYEDIKMRALPNTEAVSRLFFVGDTGGTDISEDDSCVRETRIQYIEFNPLRVRLN